MKNIGIFTHDLYPFKPWGQGRYVYDLVKHLRRFLDAKVFVFSPSDGIDDPCHIQLFKGSHRSLGKNISYSFKLALVMEDMIRRHDLGLVHFQGGPGGLFLPGCPSVPVLYTAHHTYRQQSASLPAQRWKNIFYLLEKLSYGKADHIVCVSPSTRKALLERYAVKEHVCSVVLNGVDQAQFFDTHSIRLPNSLLFLGRLEKRKGIDFLIKAVSYARSRCPELRLFIAGDGVLKPWIERTIVEQGLQNNVTLLGILEDGMVPWWYNRVTAVVVPSLFEGFGLNAAEAMACGTPVIATKVDGLRDVVDHNVNGCLVEYGNVRELGEAILCILEDDPKRQRFAKNGLLKAICAFDWDRSAQQISHIYNALL
jgi:glycosyltransferase involved in cell wall biosynthesis